MILPRCYSYVLLGDTQTIGYVHAFLTLLVPTRVILCDFTHNSLYQYALSATVFKRLLWISVLLFVTVVFNVRYMLTLVTGV